jgi:hypothetical protein
MRVYELLDLLAAHGNQLPLSEIPEHLKPALSPAMVEPCLVHIPPLGLLTDAAPRVYLTTAGRAAWAGHDEPGGSQNVKRRGGRPKKTEKDSATKVVAALNAHHRYESGSVTNYEAASNRGLAERFGVSQNALTRFLKDRFPDEERPFKKYQLACRNKTIGPLLALWNGELPGRHAGLMPHESGSDGNG